MFLVRVINQAPLWLAILVVVAIFEFYSVGLMLICRRTWGTSRLSLNNEVAGFKFSVIGVLYAVLLGFVVIVVWENYRNTEPAVRICRSKHKLGTIIGGFQWRRLRPGAFSLDSCPPEGPPPSSCRS
jgi:hypothetical protein